MTEGGDGRISETLLDYGECGISDVTNLDLLGMYNGRMCLWAWVEPQILLWVSLGLLRFFFPILLSYFLLWALFYDEELHGIGKFFEL